MKDSKNDILTFWFEETKPAQWFQSSSDFDAEIRRRFFTDFTLARSGIFDAWRDEGAEGCLALCVLLDQFPRNMFRGTAEAFATDTQALDVARHALGEHFDTLLPPLKRRFLYLPFEHSEQAADQDRCVALFETMKKEDPLGYEYALKHRDVIMKFGRFPHRNAALGRVSTPEEIAYLAEGGGF
ncbi:MAG: DUF924 domain-containing protein [Proteobacteria bacterium]|nr:DUF924 domain-containing protein [Pseudomonadota bacterium]